MYCFRDECKAQVHKFSGPVYKKFSSKSEAEDFIKQRSSVPSQKTYTVSNANITKATTSSTKRLFSTKSSTDTDEAKRPAKRMKFLTSHKTGLEVYNYMTIL